MKTLVFVTALAGAALLLAGLAQAAPRSTTGPPTASADSVLQLIGTVKSVRKPLPQSVLKLRLKGGGGPSRVQGNCTFGNDNIAHCEDCEVDWDDLTMVCIANMICYDHNGKPIPCP